MKRFVCIFVGIVVLAACREQQYTLYDNPFVYIVDNDDAAMSETSTIPAAANNRTKTYRVILSTKAFEEPVTVWYEISVGDGLAEEVDYRLLTREDSLTFLPGVFKMPVRITFLRHTLDPSKDNSITLRITGVSPEMEIGFPGPAHRNGFHKVTKIN